MESVISGSRKPIVYVRAGRATSVGWPARPSPGPTVTGAWWWVHPVPRALPERLSPLGPDAPGTASAGHNDAETAGSTPEPGAGCRETLRFALGLDRSVLQVRHRQSRASQSMVRLASEGGGWPAQVHLPPEATDLPQAFEWQCVAPCCRSLPGLCNTPPSRPILGRRSFGLPRALDRMPPASGRPGRPDASCPSRHLSDPLDR